MERLSNKAVRIRQSRIESSSSYTVDLAYNENKTIPHSGATLVNVALGFRLTKWSVTDADKTVTIPVINMYKDYNNWLKVYVVIECVNNVPKALCVSKIKYNSTEHSDAGTYVELTVNNWYFISAQFFYYYDTTAVNANIYLYDDINKSSCLDYVEQTLTYSSTYWPDLVDINIECYNNNLDTSEYCSIDYGPITAKYITLTTFSPLDSAVPFYFAADYLFIDNDALSSIEGFIKLDFTAEFQQDEKDMLTVTTTPTSATHSFDDDPLTPDYLTVDLTALQTKFTNTSTTLSSLATNLSSSTIEKIKYDQLKAVHDALASLYEEMVEYVKETWLVYLGSIPSILEALIVATYNYYVNNSNTVIGNVLSPINTWLGTSGTLRNSIILNILKAVKSSLETNLNGNDTSSFLSLVGGLLLDRSFSDHNYTDEFLALMIEYGDDVFSKYTYDLNLEDFL